MTDTRHRTGIPRVPKCEDAQCNLIAGHLGEHEQRKVQPVPERLSVSVKVQLGASVIGAALSFVDAYERIGDVPMSKVEQAKEALLQAIRVALHEARQP